VTMSYFQLYREQVFDLLVNEDGPLHVREHSKNGVYVEGLTHLPVTGAREVLEMLETASARRIIAATHMNRVSSRSHVILQLTVEQRAVTSVSSPYGVSAMPAGPVRRGVLTIVDLAGSERVSKTHSEGDRLEEAKTINKSLSVLGWCVSALSSQTPKHVPFRESKLTRILTDSLGGNSKTVLIATVGPSAAHYEETLSSLAFASRCMAVQTHARVNEVEDFRELNMTLRQQLAEMAGHNQELQSTNSRLRQQIERLSGDRDSFRYP
ncbi:kinesin-like protein, partial [Kipferlia bialata]